MKRTISIVLALVLAFGAVAASGLSVTAEEVEQNEKVEVTVEGFEYGKSASDVKITVPAGAKYEVVSTKCGKVEVILLAIITLRVLSLRVMYMS